jgi:transposase
MICAAVERCAGIDVAKGLLAVCVMIGPLNGEALVQRRRFGTTVAELEALRDWLKQERVTHVVIELIGSYWKPLVNVLETDIQIYFADPEEVKKRKGHQTDDKDGWWLAHLLRHAMIHPSFVPPLPIRELRDLTRRRQRLLSETTAEKSSIQEVLEDANVQLGNVLSDLFGASGQLMLEALLDGKAQPEEIAKFAKRSAKRKIPSIVQALQRQRISDHHRQMIRYSVKHLHFLENEIGELDAAIAGKIKDAGLEQQWKELQKLPGIQDRSAAIILAETSAEIEQFASPKDLPSLAQACVRATRAARGKNRACQTS